MIKHPLWAILTVIMCGVLVGLDRTDDIEIYAKGKAEFFKQTFGIESIPSDSTMNRILNAVDAQKVAQSIIGIMREKIIDQDGVLAVDGKAIRSTSKDGNPKSALQILTAYMTENGVVLAQESIHEKTNEIPVFQEMLNHLNIKGKIITADAMHCQKATCEKIIGGGGDYLFGLKGNQAGLYENVKLFIDDPINKEEVEVYKAPIEKNGGRVEKRTCYKVIDIDWLEQAKQWKGIKSVFAIRRETETKKKRTDETNYYITSLDVNPEQLLRITRDHWKIESMHWMLDVLFNEDECRILSESGQKSLNIMRKLALMLHKQYISALPQKTKPSVKNNMLAALVNEQIIVTLLS
jgi:predicted transposase YbfD/YdcC